MEKEKMEKFDWATFQKDHALETFKSMLGIATDGLKMLSFLNGGAAVALLAFLGNLAGKSNGKLPDMRLPMAFFIGGLVLCGLAYFACYTTQFQLFKESTTEIEENHGRPMRVTAFFMALSLSSFGVGAYLAVARF